jgi:hypothetical protein
MMQEFLGTVKPRDAPDAQSSANDPPNPTEDCRDDDAAL